MRAGALDRVIIVQRSVRIGDDGAGNEILEWRDFATMWAQKIEGEAAPVVLAAGFEEKEVIVFRGRFIAGIGVFDRVLYEGAAFEVVGADEIGRRRGLELRCTKVGP
ncbi:head-tail adaptor protein [Ancylobacter pratisalsi]|uniref:Head-tail adaptor protein n=1 Tax=Ancylobacter pratisalsi TaxID=1745854 RepID=A0A6P1YLQ6_9HYPH|nr:head-tail adaptor protein [Ancylobacter pratisalsi]QIB32684.1 head-tail adaptor protein [Ancylobacter pratisalsi]